MPASKSKPSNTPQPSTVVYRVRAYADFQNIYYGLFRPYRLKEVDLVKLIEEVVQARLRQQHPDRRVLDRVEKLMIYAAKLEGKGGAKQSAYFRRLERHNRGLIEIVFGSVKEMEVSGYLIGREDDGREHKIRTPVEKQTDHNMTADIAFDAASYYYNEELRTYDIACVLTNDADFKRAMQKLRLLKLRRFLITPRTPKSSLRVVKDLRREISEVDLVRSITRTQLENCQLPGQIQTRKRQY